MLIRDIKAFRKLQQQARLPAEAIRELQESRLRGLVAHAYRNIPYYRRLFDRAGLEPGDIESLDDLQRIPITSRGALQAESAASRIDRRIDASRISVRNTSGSSGRPLRVYLTPKESRTRQMVQFRTLLEVGMKWNDRMVQLGFPVCPQPEIHQRLGLFRTECLNRFMLPPQQFRRIQEANPTILWAYPSTLLAVCDFSGRPMNEWLRPRIMITSAETMPPVLAQRIETELDTHLFNFYGSIEAGRIAYECPAHDGLHVLADQVIVECLRDGRPVASGEWGSVVITVLGVRSSPFIRYELGDIASLTDRRCSCGSSFPLMGTPEGRVHELMVLPSGLKVTQLVAIRLVGTALPGRQFQIIQHRPDHLEILFVPDGEDESAVADRLRKQLLTRLQEPMQIDVRRVDRIVRTDAKLSAFIRKF